MPDADIDNGGVLWLNKSTGMRFVRKDVAASAEADSKKKARRQTRKSKAPTGEMDIEMKAATDI